MSDISTDPNVEAPTDASAEWDEQMAAAIEDAFTARDGGTVDDAAVAPAEEVGAEAEATAEVEPEVEPEPEVAPADVFGMDPSEAEKIIQWAAGLTPDQVAAVNAALADPAPTAAASGHGSSASPEGAEENPSLPSLPDLALLAEAVPGIGEYLASADAALRAQQDEIARLAAQQSSQMETEAQRTKRQTDAMIDQGIDSFKEQYADLSPEQIERVLQRTTDLQVLPALVSRTGNVAEAMVEAMNTAMWSDPQMQDHLIQARLDAIATEREATTEKKRRAASLGGGSGSVPGSRSSAAPANLTPEARRQQMIESVAAEIQGRAS